MAEHPSLVAGFRLALRVHKLVLAVWLVSIAAFAPAQFIVSLTAGPGRAHLPEGDLAAGDDLLIFYELIRPIAAPLLVVLALGCLTLAAWSVLWHGGTVRWWLGAGAARVRLSEILGHGVVWWWRYFRLAVVAAALTGSTLAALWWTIRESIRGADGATDTAHLKWLLVIGFVVSILALAVLWTATLRAGWLLGQSGRTSALVAWLRGLGSTIRSPLRSLLPLVVWAPAGLALLALPLIVEGTAALLVLVAAPLGSAWCWVALYLSYAPREPNEEWYRKMQERAASRVAAPPEKADPYMTTRIPTQPPD